MARVTYEATPTEPITWEEVVRLAQGKSVHVETHGGRVQRITRVIITGDVVEVRLTN